MRVDPSFARIYAWSMHVSVTRYAIHDYYGKIGNKISVESTYIRKTIELVKKVTNVFHRQDRFTSA